MTQLSEMVQTFKRRSPPDRQALKRENFVYILKRSLGTTNFTSAFRPPRPHLSTDVNYQIESFKQCADTRPIATLTQQSCHLQIPSSTRYNGTTHDVESEVCERVIVKGKVGGEMVYVSKGVSFDLCDSPLPVRYLFLNTRLAGSNTSPHTASMQRRLTLFTKRA